MRVAAELNGEALLGSHEGNSFLTALLWDRGKVTYDVGPRFGLTRQAPDIVFTAGLAFRFQ